MSTVQVLRPAIRAGYSRFVLALIWAFLAPALLLAQADETDIGEVAAFGGGSFGAGTHPFVGGSSGYAFSRNGMALIEGAYTPMGRDILWRRPDIKSPQNSNMLDFGLSFHIRVPVRGRWAPYGILGGGFAFNWFRAITTPQGALIGIDDFKGEFHTGAGLRYYIRESWGIRPEVKVIVSSRVFTRVSVGVFYTVPSTWP